MAGLACSLYFNPRPLAGATRLKNPAILLALISIHAPLRGRQGYRIGYDPSKKFQSTPPCGGDRPTNDFKEEETYFNPRPLAGATPFTVITQFAGRFQSTPPCGGDHFYFCPPVIYRISIHAPLRGRPRHLAILWLPNYFNPRPLAGATARPGVAGADIVNFNPRPLAGATSSC